MRRLLHLALCVAFLWTASLAFAGEVIDRIIAVVNRSVLLQSDLAVAARYQALLEGRSLASISDADLRSALNHLIDQQLLFDEMGDIGSFAVTDEEARAKVDEIRAQFPEATADEAWHALLLRYGLDEEIVHERIKTQLEVMRFVDLRLRPNVRIEQSDIETYYREQFLPRLLQAGGGEVALDQVSGRIRQLLTEQRIDELLSAWLHNLREQSHIDIHLEASADPASRAIRTDPNPAGMKASKRQ